MSDWLDNLKIGVDTIRQANLAHILSHYDWKKLPLTKLREIWNLIPKEEKQ